MRTIVYLRVSTEDQVERYGLPAQRRACSEFAKANGHAIVREEADEGISGATLDRPALSRALQAIRNGEAEGVLALCPDRISRDLSDLLIVDKRARLLFASEQYDASPVSRLFFQIRGAFGEYERKLFMERTQRGRIERARDGKIVGGRVAYGYEYVEGRLVIDEAKADTVREIYRWTVEGVSMREITRKLRSAGVATWSGRKWGHSSVRRILINETYAGVAHYGTHRREGAALRLRTDGERIALAVPPIIERPLWEAAQRVIANNAAATVGRPSRRYLLRGIFWCAKCGRRMLGDPNHGNPNYRCSGRDAMRHEGEACQARVLARRIDLAVWNAVRAAFSNADHLRDLVTGHYDEIQANRGASERLLEQVEALRRREESAISLMLEQPEARDAIRPRYAEARAERLRLEAEISELQRAERAMGAALSSVEGVVAAVRDSLSMLDDGSRQEFLRAAVERVDFDGNEAVIRCFFAGQNRAERQHDGTNFERLYFVVKTILAA